MKSHLKSERGAALVLELILLAVVLSLAGIALYHAYTLKHASNKAATPVLHIGSQTSKSSPETIASPTASNVLKIDEWGIQIQLESSLANTEVVSNKQTTNDQPPQSYYAFTTSRVEALGGNCASTTLQFGDIAILERFSDKPIATPDGELINNTPINGYYYVLTAPSASCSGLGVKPESTIEAQDRAALKSSLKTLSPISN